MRILRHSPSNSVAGVPWTQPVCRGSIRPPRRRWRRRVICSVSSKPSIPPAARLRTEEAWRSSERTRGWRICCSRPATTARRGSPAISRPSWASATSCARAPVRATRICVCAWRSCAATCATCRRESPWITAPRRRPRAAPHIGSASSQAPAPARRALPSRPIRTNRRDFCWPGPIRIASAARAATAAVTCWRMAGGRASQNRRHCPNPSSWLPRNWTERNARRAFSLRRRCGSPISRSISRRRSSGTQR